MQLVTQVQFSVSMLVKEMFTITEYSNYGQISEKTNVSGLTRADCTCNNHLKVTIYTFLVDFSD